MHGVTSWMPAYGPDGGSPLGWTLDVMWRLPDGFRYTTEFLIASACLTFKEERAGFVSLSGVPPPSPTDRLRSQETTATRTLIDARRR